MVPQQSQHLALPPPPLLDGPLMISGPSSPPSIPSPTSRPHQPHSTPTGTCDRPSAGGADCEDSVFITQVQNTCAHHIAPNPGNHQSSQPDKQSLGGHTHSHIYMYVCFQTYTFYNFWVTVSRFKLIVVNTHIHVSIRSHFWSTSCGKYGNEARVACPTHA